LLTEGNLDRVFSIETDSIAEHGHCNLSAGAMQGKRAAAAQASQTCAILALQVGLMARNTRGFKNSRHPFPSF
jgi:hypothetical protein